ncbi:MAG: penicillin-binding protein 2 [Mobilicoccus sp.]|nr:penicillin-binding protein 2 [Mobilicoccus sp.]
MFTLFAAQLVRLQAIDASTIAEEGLDVRSRPTVLAAQRGAILDHNGVELAASVERRTVLADQNLVPTYQVRDPQSRELSTVGVAGAAAALAPLLGQPEPELRTKLTGTDLGATLATGVEPGVWRQIAALGIPGLGSTVESVRTYPGGEPTAPLVGWVGPDGSAKESGGGLEHQLDATLTGTPGRAVYEYSRDNRVIPTGQHEVEPAVPGRSVRLTIDGDLQFIAYDAIKRKVTELEAESGYAVVVDVKTGQLRAVAQYPGFDPGDRSREHQIFGSLPFQETFEPGSTAKVMSIGAALAEGKTTPTEVFRIENRLPRSDQRFRDSHDHPEPLDLTTAGIVAQSSNIGTILIAERLSQQQLEEYYRLFGAGSATAVRFPGESAGLFAPRSEWSGSQWYTLMFGQGMAMTAVQAAGVFQTIANKGERISPTLVEGEVDGDGRFTAATPPEPVRVLPEQPSLEMSRMLETVVSESGTAAQAAIPGVRIAGKTGTAQLYGGGYTSSFIGYAPADDPQYVVAVVVQRPGEGKPYYGGTVAGPVFQEIMSYALKQTGARPGPVVSQHYPLDEDELRGGMPTDGPTAGAVPEPQRADTGPIPPATPEESPTDAAPSAPAG